MTARSSFAVAKGALPVGLVGESSPLLVILAVLAGLVATSLLLAGARFPKLTVGTFLLATTFAVCLSILGHTSYLAAILASLVTFAVLFALYLAVPRVVLALSSWWLLPALYGTYLLSTGSFSLNRTLALGLAIASALVAALLPRIGTLLLATGMGIVLAAAVWPGTMPFAAVVALALLGIVIQGADLRLSRREGPPTTRRWSERRATLGSELVRGLLTAIAVTIGLLLMLAALAPDVGAADPVHAARLATLRSSSVLNRPGFLFSKNDSFYVLGRPLPLALVGPAPGLRDRALVVLTGRSPTRAIHELRTVKTPAELAAMRRAAAITSKAMEAVGDAVRPGINESEIARVVEATFRQEGATGFAFHSIVGSGANACLPHYESNDAVMKNGFVVVDIGCTVDGYASDMTRTFPVNRSYSDSQLELIRLVQKAKQTAADGLVAGASYRKLGRAARAVFQREGLARYYLHSLGHHVGIDVHDPYADTIKPGMVITIEPGLYIQRGSPAEERFWDLGVRIEDTYLVTQSGAEALTVYPEIPYLGPDTPHDQAGGEAASEAHAVGVAEQGR
ncbi:MAG: M24 family metallopeptidase [Acidobacteria bacterium]|nr:M24 family metallopeptidase [Acidobacteriota bacterium]